MDNHIKSEIDNFVSMVQSTLGDLTQEDFPNVKDFNVTVTLLEGIILMGLRLNNLSFKLDREIKRRKEVEALLAQEKGV